MQELAKIALRHIVISDPEIHRLTIHRQIKGPKNQIQERKKASEILIQPFIRCGVVPSMKNWAHDQVTQQTKAPRKIRVSQHHVERKKHEVRSEENYRESQEHQWNGLSEARQDVIDRMHPNRRKPIELLRRMVDGMKAPKRPTMEDAWS
jgi:hypothetical protein